MKKPAAPSNESERLADLRSLDVLDTLAEERFDRITRLAKALFQVPIALISLVDDKRQWFKSRQGLTACETPRDISFCGHAILSSAVFWVENALEDERFSDNPLVAGDPNIRFYAGCPLRGRGGRNLGTLCIIDSSPRPRSAMALEQLTDLARLAENELVSLQLGSNRLALVERSPEQRKIHIDGPTGVWNRDGTLEVLELSLASCAEKKWPVTVLVGQVDEHSQLVDSWTGQGGSIILSEVAQVLRGCIREYDSIGRIADDQFLLVLAGLSEADATSRVAYFQRKIDENPILQSIGVRMHFGYTCWEPAGGTADIDLPAVDAVLEAASQSLASACEERKVKLTA